MNPTSTPEPSGKITASVVSVVGLILLWGVVWANLPSSDELLSAQSPPRAAAAPVVPELDLSIPGVPAKPTGKHDRKAAGRTLGAGKQVSPETREALPDSSDRRAGQIAEVKCDAEVQRVCPDSLAGPDRQQCVAEQATRFSPPCRRFVQRKLVRWKEAEGYHAACVDDVKRVCAGVESGDGQLLACLQEHAQDISEGCYQSLPKGHLLLRN